MHARIDGKHICTDVIERDQGYRMPSPNPVVGQSRRSAFGSTAMKSVNKQDDPVEQQ